ncbi:MAG TPA: 4Fe-4S binding protein [Caldisericia bacterium]|nr:4Fe-4S binding protein [Caldisericia bacterium]HOU07448.1 4Fe-4S binding protein [Caldisericia bacterium]HPL89979.1 4Fe-4S binding protein [Caldisericia bacterium]HQG59295.1 4Fe-4S binding protein [Caldisericia bacterium]HQH48657.1 4Fe-4S binding protein [Caldisericia bacterium]
MSASILSTSNEDQLISSLREYSLKELSSSCEFLVFVPFWGRHRTEHPNADLVSKISALFRDLGHKVTLAWDHESFPDLRVPDGVKGQDLKRDHFIFSKGIGERKVSGPRRWDTSKPAFLQRIAVAECAYEAEAVLPILAPAPSTSFLVSGSITSFLSLLPTQTIAKILLESTTSNVGSALAEVYSLLSFKTIGAVYDASQITDWPGIGKPDRKNFETKIFSSDCVAGDAYISELFGWPSYLPQVVRASIDLGSGEGRLYNVDFDGRLLKGYFHIRRMVSDKNTVFYPLAMVSRYYLKFNKDNCGFCHLCEHVCPNGSIKFDDGKMKVLGSCVKCWACADSCPNFAIEIRRSP